MSIYHDTQQLLDIEGVAGAHPADPAADLANAAAAMSADG